jgi:hypothetical protein
MVESIAVMVMVMVVREVEMEVVEMVLEVLVDVEMEERRDIGMSVRRLVVWDRTSCSLVWLRLVQATLERVGSRRPRWPPINTLAIMLVQDKVSLLQSKPAQSEASGDMSIRRPPRYGRVSSCLANLVLV